MTDRGHIGLLPRTTSLSDESYIDFIESFRAMNFTSMYPTVSEAANSAVEEEHGDSAQAIELEDIKRIVGRLPVAQVWQRFMRTHQEMMWRRTRRSFLTVYDQHLQELESAENKGPGRLIYDPDFVVPDYARKEIHLQPGGYTDDPIGGLVFHYGTKAFYQGYNDQDEHHHEFVDNMQLPEDGVVERVVDVGCSIGQCTTYIKERMPDAEVWGLDVALPLLRYAHKRASDRGIDVSFVQALAEDTAFESDSVDAILLYILFHELPLEITRKVIPEMFRIVRPGGTVSIFEFPNSSQQLPPAQRFLIDYDSRNNCEPYSPEFVYSDFHRIIEDAGFVLTPGKPSSNDFLQSLVATKPDRN